MWSLNVFHSDRRETPDTSRPRPKVVLSRFYSFRCRRVHLHKCFESGTDKPLNCLGISTFISILNFLNSLRNQPDQAVLTHNRSSCLIPSPSLQTTTTTGFLSRSTVDWVHVCIRSMAFTFIPHRCIFPPSVRLSVSPSLRFLAAFLPITEWSNDPQGLPRQSIRIRSRDLYPQLSALLPQPVAS
jgi:hypothetical protein